MRSAKNGLAGASRLSGAGLLRLIRNNVRDGQTVDAAFDAAFFQKSSARSSFVQSSLDSESSEELDT